MDETAAPASGPASVLVVEDDSDLSLAIRLTLEFAAPPFRIVGEVLSGEEAVTRWRELRPDVVVLDNRLPGMSGLDTARAILAEHPAQNIVLCTGLVDDAVLAAAADIGIRATVLKTALDSLPEVIRR